MVNYSLMPVICIAGRPNVGKSSLFNALIGHRHAVVVEQPGTTRDRLEAIVHMGGFALKIVDTGGYSSSDKDAIYEQVKAQIFQVVEEASLILLVTDAINGISPFDKEIALLLRKFNKPIILVANKTDNSKLQDEAMEFYGLGFGHPETVSCAHRRGIDGLKARMVEAVRGEIEARGQKPEEGKRCLKIAIVGRPNVGKSSFVNTLLGRKRVIVSEIPGTTRDSIDTYFTYEGDNYIFIDTAGIRHSRKIKKAVDVYSIMRSKETIERSDVAILLLDAAGGITKDDLGILDFIEENGKACLMAVNKWDLSGDISADAMEEYKKELSFASPRLNKLPIMFISSKTGLNVLDSLSTIKVLDSNLDTKVSTSFLNRIFEKNDPSVLPIPRSKRRPNFFYAVQSGTRPIEFKFFVSNPRNVLPSHLTFIENQLRANLPLLGIPIRIRICASHRKQKR